MMAVMDSTPMRLEPNPVFLHTQQHHVIVPHMKDETGSYRRKQRLHLRSLIVLIHP